MRNDNQHAQEILRQHMGPVSGYLADDAVQEVMVNNPGSIWIERNGQVSRVPETFNENALRGAIHILGRLRGKDVDEDSENAIIDTQVGDFRVAAAVYPVSVLGHTICIRKHSRQVFPLSDYLGVVDREQDAFPPRPDPTVDLEGWLHAVMRERRNLLVSGGTSSAKTSFANALLSMADPADRMLIIEDVPELILTHENLVRFVANNQIGIDTRALLRLALRYRPDRIIVGEIRGAEAFDLLQALNTGHDGGVATVHANSATQALARLETLVMTAGVGWPLEAIRSQIANTIHFVIQMKRTAGVRHVAEILEFHGLDERGNYAFKRIY